LSSVNTTIKIIGLSGNNCSSKDPTYQCHSALKSSYRLFKKKLNKKERVYRIHKEETDWISISYTALQDKRERQQTAADGGIYRYNRLDIPSDNNYYTNIYFIMHEREREI